MSGNELDLARLEAALAHELVGHTVEYYASVPSTMPLARRLAKDPTVRPGAIVIAEEQTAGRGRLTRRWDAPYGQALLLTVVLKPPLLPPEPAHVPMLAGVAAVEAMVAIAPALADDISLKWPNDILLGKAPNSMGKVAGILVEASFAGPSIEYALLGMGINVNQDSTMLPLAAKGGLAATSMRERVERSIDRSALAIAVCQRLAQQLAACGQDSGEGLYQTWSSWLNTTGRQVTVHVVESGAAVKGTVVDVDRSGNLVVVDDVGKRHTFGAGDVSLHPPPEIAADETESFDGPQPE